MNLLRINQNAKTDWPIIVLSFAMTTSVFTERRIITGIGIPELLILAMSRLETLVGGLNHRSIFPNMVIAGFMTKPRSMAMHMSVAMQGSARMHMSMRMQGSMVMPTSVTIQRFLEMHVSLILHGSIIMLKSLGMH